MATALFRKVMIELYDERRPPDLFLSGFFSVPPRGITDAETISIDIKRFSEFISPIVNTCEGPTWNKIGKFTNKEFTPPTIHEAMPINCKELLKRMAGTDE